MPPHVTFAMTPAPTVTPQPTTVCGDCNVCLKLSNSDCKTSGGYDTQSECEDRGANYRWCGDPEPTPGPTPMPTATPTSEPTGKPTAEPTVTPNTDVGGPAAAACLAAPGGDCESCCGGCTHKTPADGTDFSGLPADSLSGGCVCFEGELSGNSLSDKQVVTLRPTASTTPSICVMPERRPHRAREQARTPSACRRSSPSPTLKKKKTRHHDRASLDPSFRQHARRTKADLRYGG